MRQCVCPSEKQCIFQNQIYVMYFSAHLLRSRKVRIQQLLFHSRYHNTGGSGKIEIIPPIPQCNIDITISTLCSCAVREFLHVHEN